LSQASGNQDDLQRVLGQSRGDPRLGDGNIVRKTTNFISEPASGTSQHDQSDYDIACFDRYTEQEDDFLKSQEAEELRMTNSDLEEERSQRAAALREQAASPAITSDNIKPEKEATTPVATSSLTHQFSTSLNKKIYVSTKIVTITTPCNTRMTDHPDHQHKLTTSGLVTPDVHDDGYHSTSSQAPSTHGDEEEETMKEFLVDNITDTDSLDFRLTAAEHNESTGYIWDDSSESHEDLRPQKYEHKVAVFDKRDLHQEQKGPDNQDTGEEHEPEQLLRQELEEQIMERKKAPEEAGRRKNGLSGLPTEPCWNK
jgi:hypothetical protein